MRRTAALAFDERILVVDVSNSFTKLAVAHRERIGRVRRIPTAELTATRLSEAVSDLKFSRAMFASVVPSRNGVIPKTLRVPVEALNSTTIKGLLTVGIREPEKVGADRYANVVAAAALYGKPAIVVDFGTAVTFDVILATGEFAGGVIAPGLTALTDYLHERTALLPRVDFARPRRAVGRSTTEAMLSGAWHGYRGLVSEIIAQLQAETFAGRRVKIVATGGDAAVISRSVPSIAVVAPNLTLHGIRIAAQHQLSAI